ncbi:hypothetical protein NQD34_018431 [Periophthalmus magnuspinnatus]|nr:hypothetical protein NQD34_018431 [Periophthalmus magnuspinnatus]
MNPFEGSVSSGLEGDRGGGRSMPVGRFSSWLECVCVVTFDLELGQALEKTSICYLSFPDSYSGCLGDTQFSFRMRQSVGRRGSRDGDVYNRDAPLTLQSLVLLSRLPYTALFHSLLQIIAPEYFEKLEPCLETVCNEIDQWPKPVPGMTLNLPVMGVILQIRIPSKSDKPGGSPIRNTAKEISHLLIVTFSISNESGLELVDILLKLVLLAT